MNNANDIDIYRYMDNNLRILREEELKRFLIDKQTIDLNFFDLDLYSQDSLIKTKIKNEIFKSKVNSNIRLTKYQVEILQILENNNIFISAPTSFGKTFILLEYLYRNKEKINNVVFIIPTLALMNELLKKIFSIFKDDYNICINSTEEISNRNIFVFVPERSDSNFIKIINELSIDLLIFDEIYKLQGDKKKISSDDRLIYMNKVYLDLVKYAKKIALLGPYINHVEFENTNIKIIKYYTNFMPVYNKIGVLPDNSRWEECLKSNKNLVYFKKPESIYTNISGVLSLFSENSIYENIYKEEIGYLEKIIGNNWFVIQLLKRGIGIHHGKTPMFLRKFYENEYNKGNIKTLLCTSTLMEGINTPTESLIIVDKPNSNFELNNLIGRVGRLNPVNPKVGNVIICDKDTLNFLNNTDTWLDLKILAEEKEVYTNDEVLYLDKKYNDLQKQNEYENKLKILNEKYNITKDDILKHNTEFDKTFSFFSNDFLQKFNSCNNTYECIKLTIELIPAYPYLFRIDKYDSLYSADKYLPYKTYINAILNGKTFKQIIQEFNNKYNISNNVNNINYFIDALFNITNYIKFRFSKILNYLEFYDKSSYSDNVKKFIQLISAYNEMDVAYKILDDLGIETNDAIIIVKHLNINNNISASKMIKLLKEHKDDLMTLNLSPFSKNNINNL